MNRFDAYNNQKKKILYCNRKNIKLISGSELRQVGEFREIDTGQRESRGMAAHRGCNRFMKGGAGRGQDYGTQARCRASSTHQGPQVCEVRGPAVSHVSADTAGAQRPDFLSAQVSCCRTCYSVTRKQRRLLLIRVEPRAVWPVLALEVCGHTGGVGGGAGIRIVTKHELPGQCPGL